MEKDQIVIVTQIQDPHADDVIPLLQQTGLDPIRLNTDDVPTNTRMSLGLEKDAESWTGSIEILTNGRSIDPSRVRSVWWRRPTAFALPTELSKQERMFAQGEIDHALRSFWSSLDCYWINHPDHVRQASWKGEQLQRAARLGFEVPSTLVTTDPEQARDFYDTHDGRVIFKVMTDTFLGRAELVAEYPDEPSSELYETPTTLLTETELELLDTIDLVPCLFQEYVPKQLELRLTVIGDEVFAAAIYSQAHETTSIDWRHYDVEIPYQEAELPDEITDRCLAFVKSYGLNFGAIDLILTPDDRYVFIENNPNGQFIFVEHLVPELRMTEALAACLIRGANS